MKTKILLIAGIIIGILTMLFDISIVGCVYEGTLRQIDIYQTLLLVIFITIGSFGSMLLLYLYSLQSCDMAYKRGYEEGCKEKEPIVTKISNRGI